MKKTNLWLWHILVPGMCTLVLLVSTSQAVEVKHNGSPIFSDGFEGVSTGGFPDASKWEILYEIYGGSLEVVDGSGAGDPAPFEGSQYVKLQGDDAAADGPYLTMEADLGSLTTGTIHAEWMVYIPSNSNPGGSAGGLRTSPSREPRVSQFWNLDSIGQVQGQWNDLGSADYSRRDPPNTTDIPYTADTWQKWEIDFDLGTADDGSDDRYVVTVDGISSGTLTTWREHSDVGSINFGLRYGNGDGDIFYVDAVPEPSTILILSSGILALIAYVLPRRR